MRLKGLPAIIQAKRQDVTASHQRPEFLASHPLLATPLALILARSAGPPQGNARSVILLFWECHIGPILRRGRCRGECICQISKQKPGLISVSSSSNREMPCQFASSRALMQTVHRPDLATGTVTSNALSAGVLTIRCCVAERTQLGTSLFRFSLRELSAGVCIQGRCSRNR